jgi:hypothetical protein
MTPQWLTSLIMKSAFELERSQKALFRFGAKIEDLLKANPVRDWEADLWGRGLKNRLIRLEGHFFRVGTGKKGCLSFFVRNPDGLQVGLRRESITQAATYVSLITDFGYPRAHTRFETGWMDVAVYDDDGRALLYAENKANQKVLEKLCGRLSRDFEAGIPFPDETEKKPEDAIMKAQHIWRHRPKYFVGICPTSRAPFAVDFGRDGFSLRPIDAVPSSLEWAVPVAPQGQLV